MITKSAKFIVGKHNSVSVEKYDREELKAGIKVEHEHTDVPEVAEAIAKDHLAEFPDYYTRLRKMEEAAEKYWHKKEAAYAQYSDALFHSTNKDSLERILGAGRIKTLKHVAKESPDKELSVELSPIPLRRNMAASRAVDYLGNVKDVENVYFTRGGVVSNYGDYVIAKALRNTKESPKLNSIPNEHITSRPVSIRRKAKIFVPDNELEEWTSRYPEYSRRFMPKSALKASPYGLTDRTKALYSKLTKSAAIQPRELSRNALIGGSTGLGIDADGSDVDYFIPYKRKYHYDRALQRITSKYPELKQRSSTLKNDSKTTFTGVIDGKEVDVVLGAGDKANNYLKAYTAARESLTPEQRAEIIKRKRELKNSWFFPKTRYKMYKNNLAQELNLKQHYF